MVRLSDPSGRPGSPRFRSRTSISASGSLPTSRATWIRSRFFLRARCRLPSRPLRPLLHLLRRRRRHRHRHRPTPLRPRLNRPRSHRPSRRRANPTRPRQARHKLARHKLARHSLTRLRRHRAPLVRRRRRRLRHRLRRRPPQQHQRLDRRPCRSAVRRRVQPGELRRQDARRTGCRHRPTITSVLVPSAASSRRAARGVYRAEACSGLRRPHPAFRVPATPPYPTDRRQRRSRPTRGSAYQTTLRSRLPMPRIMGSRVHWCRMHLTRAPSSGCSVSSGSWVRSASVRWRAR